MTRLGRTLVVVSLLAAPLGRIQAQRQAAPRTTATWVTIGVGQVNWGFRTDLGAQITAAHQSHHRVLSARIVGGGDILGGLFASQGEIVAVQDAGVLLGYGNAPGLVHYAVGAGLGIATLTRRGTPDDTKSSKLGVPLEGQIFIQPLRFLGVGLYGYGDINKDKSFWGWSISAVVGRLR